ncbi:MAG TPA: glycosyltransferase family A protein [Gemmatimonadaceae bacterium]|nr:glycosyltransferase family A protein [Gemmatimonadaceae bacterium]
MSKLLFSIVVPTFNRPAELATCLDAIANCGFDRGRFEVVVVNDGGDDPEPVLESARSAGINLRRLSKPNRGPAAARNYGASAARGDFLAFIDDDCIPAKDWLTRLEESVAAYPLALHGGRTVNLLRGNRCSQASQSLVDYVYRYYNDRTVSRTFFFASNNIAVATSLFAQIGGFDESFRTAEDRDFCRSWHAKGWGFHYSPSVTIHHAHHLTLRTLQKQHFSYGRGALPYWRKSSAGSGRIRVEPLSFYAGMMAHPFSQHIQRPALVASLILISQVANAAGFAYEAFRTRGHAGAILESRRKAPARI